MNSLLLGADFGQGLLNGLRNGLAANILQPGLMLAVGDFGANSGLGAGSMPMTIMHASVGALGGAIMGGGRGALGGALGAGLSELIVPNLDVATDTQRTLSQLIGGMGSLIARDGSLSGATSALNGLEYNELLHKYPRATEMRSERNVLRERLNQCGNCNERQTLEAELNQLIRNQIAQAAVDHVDRTDWMDAGANENFIKQSNKCNLFVADMLRLVGIDVPTPNGRWSIFGLDGSTPPQASQWANPNYSISNWEVLQPGQSPQPGDVAAQQIAYNDASGHVMVVGPNGAFVGTGRPTNPNLPGGTIVQKSLTTFAPPNVAAGPIVYRRYTGIGKR